MIITVASGKGGAGKTFAAVHLYAASQGRAFLADCDVEEPNALLFLKQTNLTQRAVYRSVPVVAHERCSSCGTCSSFCAYGSIALLGTRVMTFPDLCRSCGGCTLLCPEQAITEHPLSIGYVEQGPKCSRGVLKVGSISSVPLIREVIAGSLDQQLLILDGPPGANCPAMAASAPADHVLLVAEPTPFGLHDLKGMVDALQAIKKPFSVLINKARSRENIITTWCRQRGYPISGVIMEDHDVRSSCIEGRISPSVLPQFERILEDLT